jgi:UDP-N-acetylmuramoylalanine--D-glutamate ligase
VTVLVEGFEPDQLALARSLAASGASVRLAGAGPAPEQARALAAQHGVALEPYADLDADPGAADIAYLDVWTPAVAPRVTKLCAQGTRISCLGDLLLERATGPTVGVTGTAGKTTTTGLTVQLLRASGVDVDASTAGRLGNVWPTAELLDRPDPTRLLVLELTSSHLAFMRQSSHTAVITSFWPDHLELHGSLHAYRAAKEVIVRGQRPGDTLVVNADDARAASFAEITPAGLVEASLEHPVERGAFARDGAVVVRWDDAETAVGQLVGLPYAGRQRLNVLAALATALAAGAPPGSLPQALARVEPAAHRTRQVAFVNGARVIDDGMAATPSKTAAALAAYPGGSVVLIAGGIDDPGTGPVHRTPEERELLEHACDEIARTVRLAVLFGSAAAGLEQRLAERAVPVHVTTTLDEAIAEAADRTGGAAVIVFSPLYPVALEDRRRFAALARALE